MNKIHIDEDVGWIILSFYLNYLIEIAKNSIFKTRICHGLLGASLFSQLCGNYFPGAIYLKQELKFENPIFLNEEVILSDINCKTLQLIYRLKVKSK